MLSTGTRKELADLVAQEFSAVAPREQPVLDFSDITASKHNGNRQSLKAAREGESRRPNQRKRIWLYIHEQGGQGATVEEISKALSIRYTTVSARCSEMKRDLLIKESGRTRQTDTQSDADVLVTM